MTVCSLGARGAEVTLMVPARRAGLFIWSTR